MPAEEEVKGKYLESGGGGYVPVLSGQVFTPQTDEDFALLFGEAGPAMKVLADKPREPKRYSQVVKADKKPSLRPLAGRCVVRPDKPEEKRGQIVLPDVAKERPCRGVVLAVGPGKPMVKEDGSRYAEMSAAPVEVKAGDRVAFPYATGHRLEFDGEEVLVINQEDLIAVVEGEG